MSSGRVRNPNEDVGVKKEGGPSAKRNHEERALDKGRALKKDPQKLIGQFSPLGQRKIQRLVSLFLSDEAIKPFDG